ncbi:MAG: DMT family transporter [Actinomycetota bacterium]|nr:DMT family transporter [Actinomycetota bacterium]
MVAASTSAVLVRYASGAEPLAIAFWRCAAGAAVLAPFARRRLRRLDGAVVRLPLLAGAFLAIHFATWITSIRLTTIASSVLLVSTTPVFIAVAGWVLWNEKTRRATWVGIGIALAGTALIGGADIGGSSLAGDVLAVIGAATAGGYYMTGQLARRDLGILEYATITYAAAAVLLLGACLVTGVPLSGFSGPTSWALVGLIVGPQLLGHTLINFALKDIDPATVSVTVMAEPVLSAVLALLLLGEVPTPLTVPGGAAVLLGIYLVTSAHPMNSMVVE